MTSSPLGAIPALQPGEGPIGSTYLPSTLENVLWGRLPCADDDPVLRVEPGTAVTFDTISHEGILEDQGRDPRRFFESRGAAEVLDDAIAIAASDDPHVLGVDGPHVVSRPVHVAGAEPGDLLAMTVLDTLPRVPYGVISNRHGKGALPGEYPLEGDIYSVYATARTDPDDPHPHAGPAAADRGSRAHRHVPARPVPRHHGGGRGRPRAPALGSARPARRQHRHHLLTVGSTLYLPVQVAGALAYVGDPHFAQGDGEVSLTAMEASLRATVRLDVVAREDAVASFGDVVGPLAETAELLVPTGLDEDLDVAVANCVRHAIALLGARYGMDPRLAYAYLSAATDFEISQVVDVVKGVHASIRKADFAIAPR